MVRGHRVSAAALFFSTITSCIHTAAVVASIICTATTATTIASHLLAWSFAVSSSGRAMQLAQGHWVWVWQENQGARSLAIYTGQSFQQRHHRLFCHTIHRGYDFLPPSPSRTHSAHGETEIYCKKETRKNCSTIQCIRRRPGKFAMAFSAFCQ